MVQPPAAQARAPRAGATARTQHMRPVCEPPLRGSPSEIEFATDSPLEGDGFELPDPREPLPEAKRYASVYSDEKAALEAKTEPGPPITLGDASGPDSGYRLVPRLP